MNDYKELIRLSKKAAKEWENTDGYYQASSLLSSLCSALEIALSEREAMLEVINYLANKNPKACTVCKHSNCVSEYGYCTGFEWKEV